MNDQTSNSSGDQTAGQNGQRFFGKFRGKVLDNLDPLGLGRIIPEVPAVSGAKLNWAMPCTPYAGDQVGFYAIPPIGASVWVEFEGGDPNYPIWVGCFWDEGEMPEIDGPPVPERKVFKTEFITMVLNDIPEEGGFSLRCFPEAVDIPLTMVFNSEGILIECPESTIQMTPESIKISVPESEITMTPESISALTGAVTVNAGEAIEANAGEDVTISAEGAIEVSAIGDVSVSGLGAAELSGGGDVSIEAGGAVEVTAGLDLALSAGLAAELNAGADVEIGAIGATEITSVGIAITGLVEVTGDLLIDGQQPIVI